MENGFPLEKQNSPISHLLCPFAFLLIKKHLRILICDFEIYRAQSPTLNNRWLYFSGFLFHSSYFWHRASIRLRIFSTLPPSRQLRSQATSTFASPCHSTRSHIRQQGSLSSAIPLIQRLPPHAVLTVASLSMPHLNDPFLGAAVALTPPLHSLLPVSVPSLHPMFLNLFVKIRGLTPLSITLKASFGQQPV